MANWKDKAMILDKKPTAVVYMAHCYPNGLVYHMAYLARELILLTKNGGPRHLCVHQTEHLKVCWRCTPRRPEAKFDVNDYDEI